MTREESSLQQQENRVIKERKQQKTQFEKQKDWNKIRRRQQTFPQKKGGKD